MYKRQQIGGGFARYSVDAGWVVPHFEKMLYDNALLLGSYTRGWRRVPDHDPVLRAQFERVIRGIVGWLDRDLRTESGGFASSLDADSLDARGMQHEGIYYCWTPELLRDALGEDNAQWAADTFHVTTTGTFEHGLSTLQPVSYTHLDVYKRQASVRLEVGQFLGQPVERLLCQPRRGVLSHTGQASRSPCGSVERTPARGCHSGRSGGRPAVLHGGGGRPLEGA